MVSRASGDLLLEFVYQLLEPVTFTVAMIEWLMYELIGMKPSPAIKKITSTLDEFETKFHCAYRSSFEPNHLS